MTFLVILWSWGILKVVDPGPTDPLYIFYDGECKLKDGKVVVKVIDLMPPDPTERVGTLTQGKTTCDVEEMVYPGI